MTCDEVFYRQYLSGDDAGLEALMKKYGDPLTLYIDGYLHDVHEAEELMLDVFAYLFTKKPKIRDGGFKAYLYKAARHMALRHKSKRKPLFINSWRWKRDERQPDRPSCWISIFEESC